MMKKMGQEIGEVDCHLIIGFTDLVLRLFHSEKKKLYSTGEKRM